MQYIKRDNVYEIQDSDTNVALQNYNENDSIIYLNTLTYRKSKNSMNYIETIGDVIPDNIKHLYLSDYNFDNSVDKLLQSLHSLIFYQSSKFNQSVNKLPQSLHTLEFGDYFNQPIDKLPRSLKKLTLRSQFNQNLDFLPESLEILDISYNNYIEKINDLPSSIKKIMIIEYQRNKINKIYHHKLDIQDDSDWW